MRREQIVKSIRKIQKDLDESDASRLFFSAARHTTASKKAREDPAKVFSVYADLSARMSQYNDIDKGVLVALQLRQIADPDLWQFLSIAFSEEGKIPPASSEKVRLFRKVSKALELLNTSVAIFIGLLDREFDNNSARGPNDDGTHDILTVRLVEEEGELSSPTRVAQLMCSVDNMYSSIARFVDADSVKLAVAAIDSGSDKSFDLLGAAKILEILRDVFMQIFNHKRINRKLDGDALAAQVMQTLPLLEQLQTSVAEGALDEAEATLIKKGLIDSIKSFINVGAVTPEMENAETPNPRLTMRPEPKLLLPPGQTEKTKSRKKKKKKKKKADAADDSS